MTNEEFKTRVEIMRDVGVMKFRDGEEEIVLFAPDSPAANDNAEPEDDRKRRDRRTFGGR